MKPKMGPRSETITVKDMGLSVFEAYPSVNEFPMINKQTRISQLPPKHLTWSDQKDI